MSSFRSRLAIIAVVGTGLFVMKRLGAADAEDQTLRNERCAIRVSAALTGDGPTAELLASPSPQSTVDAMVQSPKFIERFASFANARFNRFSGIAEDATYFVAKKVLTDGKPWKDLFVGPYDVALNASRQAQVTTNTDGLGYFRSMLWLSAYAGNETAGIKINTAFRILNNTVGFSVPPTTVQLEDDSAEGRKQQPCAQCHYENWFALDRVANILTRLNKTDNGELFLPPPAGASHTIDGKTVTNDKELVQFLVDSEDYQVAQCRLAFDFLFGRRENSCEGTLIDSCIDALKGTGMIQAGVAAIAKSPTFCE